MKSSIRAALAVGALAFAATSASASTLFVGDTEELYFTTNVTNPNFAAFSVGAGVTGVKFGLVDTQWDGQSYTFQLYSNAATAGNEVGSSWTWTDSGTQIENLGIPPVYRALSSGSYVLEALGISNNANFVSVNVSAVPLPAAAWLFGSALLGLGALRRKQKSAAKSEMALA